MIIHDNPWQSVQVALEAEDLDSPVSAASWSDDGEAFALGSASSLSSFHLCEIIIKIKSRQIFHVYPLRTWRWKSFSVDIYRYIICLLIDIMIIMMIINIININIMIQSRGAHIHVVATWGSCYMHCNQVTSFLLICQWWRWSDMIFVKLALDLSYFTWKCVICLSIETLPVQVLCSIFLMQRGI